MYEYTLISHSGISLPRYLYIALRTTWLLYIVYIYYFSRKCLQDSHYFRVTKKNTKGLEAATNGKMQSLLEAFGLNVFCTSWNSLMHGKCKCEIPWVLYIHLEYCSFESNKTLKYRAWVIATSDSKSSSVTLNTCKPAITARRLFCDFVALFQGSLLQRRFIFLKWCHKANCCLEWNLFRKSF